MFFYWAKIICERNCAKFPFVKPRECKSYSLWDMINVGKAILENLEYDKLQRREHWIITIFHQISQLPVKTFYIAENYLN